MQASITKRLGRASARAFDRSQAANVIGVFSRDVEVLDARVQGDNAVVTIQVADRLPLEEVELVRRDGKWIIRTDPPIAGLAGELRKLADVLVAVARMVDDREMTAAQIKRELDLRQAPIGRRLAVLMDETPP